MNGTEPTPRVKFLLNLLESENIKYELDVFFGKDENERSRMHHINSRQNDNDDESSYENNFFNIVLRGNSNKMVIAHHDISNPMSDNANDNSCSVINAIALKKLRPNLNVVLTDGEELGGIGSQRLAKKIKDGDFGSIAWVLNLELTGKGGKYFFIGDYPGPLTNHIKSIFDCPIVHTPFNDSVILKKKGIDSVVINPIPPTEGNKQSQVKYGDTYLDFSVLFRCHSPEDSVDKISPSDMKEFIEEVVLKIVD